MNENIKELIESLPNEGVDCKGREWVRYKPTAHNFVDRTGEVYERLIALFPVQEKEKGKTKTMWLCRCSCGNFIVVSGSDLKTRNTRSCGCLHTELSIHMNDKKREEIIGMRFGRLTVISFHGVKDSKSYFLCKCDCGNEIIASMTKLKNGNTKSCGCLQRDIMVNRYAQKREEMIGMRFGKLTVISFHGIKDEKAQFLCKCDCGNEVIVGSNQLKTGYVKSCGCLLKESPFHRYDKYRQEMIGKQFGYLKVLAFEKIQNHSAYYSCLCELCGSITVKRGNTLLSGRIKSCGCMKESYGESKITEILEKAKIPYRKQQTFDDLRSDNKIPLRYDFAIMNESNEITRLIEFDGEQHFHINEYFGGEEEFARRKHHDALKNQYAISHNIPLVRIPYSKRDSMTLDDLLSDKYTITKQ